DQGRDGRTTQDAHWNGGCREVPRLNEELVGHSDELLCEVLSRHYKKSGLNRCGLCSHEEVRSDNHAESNVRSREQRTSLRPEKDPIRRWQQQDGRDGSLLRK